MPHVLPLDGDGQARRGIPARTRRRQSPTIRALRAAWYWLRGGERRLAFYEWDLRQHPGLPDPAVVERPPSALPGPVRRPLGMGRNPLLAWLTALRWRRGQLRCFVLMADGVPVACGAIRGWSLHRRECAWLGRPGPVLGSAWTDPSHRGRGFHHRLILHRLHACAAAAADVVYVPVHVDNITSRRNLERVGFRPRGCVVVRHMFFRLFLRVRPLDAPAAVGGGPAQERARP